MVCFIYFEHKLSGLFFGLSQNVSIPMEKFFGLSQNVSIPMEKTLLRVFLKSHTNGDNNHSLN